MTERQVAVVVGVGPGLGNALVRRCAAAGMRVAAASRKGAAPETNHPDLIRGYRCDAAVAKDVAALFTAVDQDFGPPDLVIFNVGTFDRGGILDLTDQVFEQAWRRGCFGGFLVGRAAAAAMLPRGRGTIIFTGATGSIRGSAGFAAFAVPKFGLRALAQSMARELGPQGIHVAHVIIDGLIDDEGEPESEKTLGPAAIADAYYHLHEQRRSAWAHEIDLRPAREKF